MNVEGVESRGTKTIRQESAMKTSNAAIALVVMVDVPPNISLIA